jgi:hypothetical protein
MSSMWQHVAQRGLPLPFPPTSPHFTQHAFDSGFEPPHSLYRQSDSAAIPSCTDASHATQLLVKRLACSPLPIGIQLPVLPTPMCLIPQSQRLCIACPLPSVKWRYTKTANRSAAGNLMMTACLCTRGRVTEKEEVLYNFQSPQGLRITNTVQSGHWVCKSG